MENGRIMKILVCVKQVPDTEAHPVISGDPRWIEEEKIAFRMNRYDEYALEEALIIKDQNPGTVIDVITAGPERAGAVLRKGLEKGADHSVHLRFGGYHAGAYETADLIASYAEGKNYDLIFAGVMSEDAMQSQVGPMIASLLSIPCAVSAVKTEIDYNEKIIIIQSELEGGYIETFRLKMPCLITFQTGISQPRYPSLSNVLRARSMFPEVIDCKSKTQGEWGRKLAYSESGDKGIRLNGSIEEKAVRLVEILHARGFL